MGDLKLFRVTDGVAMEVPGASLAVERQVQSLIERNMEAMLGIRFLASEYETGPRHRGRIDSLGLDENGSPVIVEYKRRRDANVISQVFSYLSWLDDHRHEFTMLVQARLGSDAAASIEWGDPRLVCIAGDYTWHDEQAVGSMGRRIDLVRYRDFGDGLLTLELVASAPAPPSAVRRRATDRRARGAAASVASSQGVREVLEHLPDSLRDLYEELHSRLIAPGDVESVFKQHYIAYRRMVNIACVHFQPAGHTIVVYLKVDPSKVELRESFTRDVRDKGHWGTGDLEVRIKSRADLERAEKLIRLAYDAG
ncbi:endonuclease NucS domain-containing protein [Streptomyces aidingensis]|uniref:Predicted transport protein n=1 Tax=Streptomyces aidingensis TaxID=910347 RepID=A0A1I1KH78_9ACTN|nr:endonuclease NucS domain-containing protein [Streptomyces aidingensis]SFC59905.1 Predicted transport protein [Streptomyces aidingensis]